MPWLPRPSRMEIRLRADQTVVMQVMKQAFYTRVYAYTARTCVEPING